jgi:hypothetical protein
VSRRGARDSDRVPRLLLMRLWFLLMVWTIPTIPLHAQETSEPTSRGGVRATLDLSGMRFDNFFQAPIGQPQTTVHAGSARARLADDFLGSLGGEIYVDGRVTVFGEFKPTYGAGAGVVLDRWNQRLDISLGHDWWLPRLDVGDGVGRADVGAVRGAYSVRMGRILELSALGSARLERFLIEEADIPVPDGEGDGPTRPAGEWLDHTFVEAGGSARTRIFGRYFSPEVGLTTGGPRGWDAERTYEQIQMHVQIRSRPARQLYLSGRYRVRERQYPGATPGSRNFGRLDRREQLTVTADFATTRSVSWILYYAYEDARSSLASRSFATHLLSLGVRVREF